MSKDHYNHQKIEDKWSSKWGDERVYEVDLEKAEKPFYNLMMFPYPSAEGLHVGNVYAFVGADIYGRYQRLLGKDVFEPIGLDGFGIHSENYALKIGKHPAEQAKISEKNFYKQLKMIGNGFAWENKLETYKSEYYGWTQWMFVQMYKNGLAYKKAAQVNWCGQCKTVLADEQVEAGACERCKSKVERREVESWHFKITDYADKLLENIDGEDKDSQTGKVGPVEDDWEASRDGLRWPEKIKTAQRQWIGRKKGVKVKFDIKGKEFDLEIFTTRLDTIFGTTFMAVSPETVKSWQKRGLKVSEKVENYVEESLRMSDQERLVEAGEKSGVRLEKIRAINPVNEEELPVYVGDYVLSTVGTGAVMGVPGHDQRDYDFAEKYGLPIEKVIKPEDGEVKSEGAFEEDGVLVNSGKYSDLSSKGAREEILESLESRGLAERQVNYHLRDWVISRQRYWGPPIPMVKCEKCDWQPVPEEELPVELPDIEEYKPKGGGTTPLSNAPDEWKETECPKCGGKAKRELNVSDSFVDSSWYFLAYVHMNEGRWVKEGKNEPFVEERLEKWLPVDAYIGGAEHAVLHLLYSRFVTMALHDFGYLSFEEPFPFLYSHGLIIKDGSKMSKSKGNVINPDEYIEKYGADALRTYLMFLGPYSQGGDFQDSGMRGVRKWLDRVYRTVLDENKQAKQTTQKSKRKLAETIKKAKEDYEKLSYNTVVAALMEFSNMWREEGEKLSKKDMEKFLVILSPLAPFISEELYEEIGGEGLLHQREWPEFEEKLLEKKQVEIPVQVNGKLRAVIKMEKSEAQDEKKVVEKALKQNQVQKYVEGKERKVVFVPGRLVNLVIKE